MSVLPHAPRTPPEPPLSAYLSERLDAARDLYLLALAIGTRGTHAFGALIQEARLHFISVIEEARVAGLETIDIQNMLSSHDIDLEHAIRPELRERLDELLRMHANPR
jgi:hypothetical protein